MYFGTVLLSNIALAVTYGSAFPDFKISSRQNSCPSVWANISFELTGQFATGLGYTDSARAAIRAAFHDCFSGPGGCGRSLILAGELDWDINSSIRDIGNTLSSMAMKYSVGAADIIQFAAAHAIKTCTNGPTVQILIGRREWSTPAPQSEIPGASDSSDTLLSLFAQKGFTDVDLTALIGAHTCARQFTTDLATADASLDRTPGTWDVAFYQQTLGGTVPFSFQSDVSIMHSTQTAPIFQLFAGNVAAWE
ncbi:class II peroxidase [Glonium stellatum]|uniref:Peroxidase n=1 Tax=Glonium stellatum TaxID=574774 RepID=A0A8E2ET41_9PEZI|nr:class II peroxidase [Glonium stellatum]